MTAAEADPFWRSLLWRWLGRWVYRATFHNWYQPRRVLLRWFGADIHPKADIRPTIDLDRPWNFAAGELTLIGDFAVFRARRPLRVGARCVISQYAVITTECLMEDGGERAAPVTIGDDCWVAAEALVMPGVEMGAGAVAGARSLIEESLGAWQVAGGEPARVLGGRGFK